jgi:endoglucanase
MVLEAESAEFLEKMLRTNTPSGHEAEGQLLWKERTKAFCDSISGDVHGNVIAAVNEKAPLRVMLAGHCDEIGFMVTHITPEGFLCFAAIGGVDAKVLPGTQVAFLNESNTFGVIGKRPIHFEKGEERKNLWEIRDLWIDIGALNREEAEAYTPVGTAGCIAPNYTSLLNQRVTSKAWDNKVGSFLVSEVLKLLTYRRDALKVAVYGVSTVQEEIGSRGAVTAGYGIDPHVGIALDVSFATDIPTDDKKIAGDISLSKGPILHRGPNMNPVLTELFKKTAKKKKIPVQWAAEPGVSLTDADVLQISRAGVATGLVSIPTRYIHTPVETCSMFDVERAARLIADTIVALSPDTDFRPY